MGPAKQIPTLPGQVREDRGYFRWESPSLAINGEGRVGPVVPGCQTVTTIIGPDGETLAHSKVWRGPPNVEGGGERGQRTIDMSPTTPHTVTKRARQCVSCHSDPRALGYGIGGGVYQRRNSEPVTVDLTDVQGNTIPSRRQVQLHPVPDLSFDWSRFVTEEGEQLQTVGHHFPLSGPLPQEVRERVTRVGACLACHQDIPDGTPFIRALTMGSDLVMPVRTDEDHSWVLSHVLNTAAAGEILVPPVVVLVVVVGLFFFLRRRRHAREERESKHS